MPRQKPGNLEFLVYSGVPKIRLDSLLVARGLFQTLTKAQAALMAGKVWIAGKPAPKAGTLVAPDVPVSVLPDAVPYVSRGGLKLAAALDKFSLRIEGRVALDVGASTGGFTDCLLQRGAKKVYAVDVGRGQLDVKLRKDARVVNMEKTHARDLRPGMFPEPPDLAVIDVSFISLSKVLPHVLPCLSRPADIVALIKPQFELAPKKVPKGVVREEKHRLEAVEDLRRSVGGLRETGLMESPIKGPKGNVEFLWCLTAPASGRSAP